MESAAAKAGMRGCVRGSRRWGVGEGPGRTVSVGQTGLLTLAHDLSPPGLHVGGNRRPGEEPTQDAGERVNFTQKGSRLICEPWTRSADVYLLCLVKAIGFHCARLGRHSSRCCWGFSAGHRPQLADQTMISVVLSPDITGHGGHDCGTSAQRHKNQV